jgi:hypothetical protein
MPCDSRYLEPNGKETKLKQTAQLLVYVLSSQGKTVSKQLVAASSDIYCRQDYVAALCAEIRKLSPNQLQYIMYDGHNPKARKLADWWDEHVEADRQRKRYEKEQLKGRIEQRNREIAAAEAILRKHGKLR